MFYMRRKDIVAMRDEEIERLEYAEAFSKDEEKINRIKKNVEGLTEHLKKYRTPQIPEWNEWN